MKLLKVIALSRCATAPLRRAPLDAWQATQSAGGINLVRPDLFLGLVKYYRMVDQFLVAVDGRHHFAEEETTPFVHLGPDYFYSGTELHPKFRAYLDRRDLVLSGSQIAIDFADSLLVEIGSELE